MSEGNFFLKYSRLKKEYNLTNFNINTSGLLEYNDNQKSFIYANPWNSVFCKIYEPDSIIKFNFQGSFNSIITNSSKHNWPQQDTVQYFINDIQSNSDNFFILFQTFLGNRRSSNYYLLQKYDWNGKLLVEIPVISAQEPILRINLAGCTDDTLYVLVKLAKQGYILQKIPLR